MFCSLLRCGCLCAVQDIACLTTLVVLCLPPNSCLEPTQSTFSCAETAVLSPALGVTKQSPYPLLWEHEVKGTVAYDRHLFTYWPLSLLIHINHHHWLLVSDKDTMLLNYIIRRIHPPGSQPLHKVLCKKYPCLVTGAKKLFIVSINGVELICNGELTIPVKDNASF